MLELNRLVRIASKERTEEREHILAAIQEKYPEIILASTDYFEGTEFINVLVIHVPDSIPRYKLEKDFPCELIEVRYKQKPS